MLKRIAAIAFIYACTVGAWMVLGKVVTVRTARQDEKLRGAVGRLWGAPQTQEPPGVYCLEGAARRSLALDASNIEVDLSLDHRKKGLLWYSTYKVGFKGSYTVSNPTGERREILVDFALPVADAMYDDFRFAIGGVETGSIPSAPGKLSGKVELDPGQSAEVEVSYRSQGLDEWRYALGGEVKQAKNFTLAMTTDFDRVDYPPDGTSPTSKRRTEEGWSLEWRYASLLSGTPIGMVMPQKLNPGPWVSRVCYTAPVSLFLFFFLIFVLTTLRGIDVHPVNYFFASTAFFSFHLLLAYLVDHVNVHVSFVAASAVSIFLLVSYMRLAVGRRFAFLEVGVSQFVYLVVFSYTFFLEGFTGLAVTVLCIVTLFIVMQLTGRVNWEEIFARRPGAGQGPERSPRAPESA